ncbi:MAG: regulatory iron-sulfur-containing complex subunit RicT [Desulfobulbus sp.]|nr:regulatory iron-sulfur-containing complex subunit RicT [Desulfobulbus sp.]
MTDVDNESQPAEQPPMSDAGSSEDIALYFFKIRFRKQGQEFTAGTLEADLHRGDIVLVRTDHGPEPAIIVNRTAGSDDPAFERPANFRIERRADTEEQQLYDQLPAQEYNAYQLCRNHIERLQLPMNLVRVEQFFNGSKIIFYFTAESRVDFRELVKSLVQEFRTRVEMRQIGVRHETQMTGGLGACGRELCCTSFLNKFDSVSIKMAKAQDLPLNPAKISGLCNRLLCCLTYEYETYKVMKKGMPRVGRQIQFEGKTYFVTRQIPLLGKIAATCGGEERLLSEDEWRAADPIPKNIPRKGPGKKGGGKPPKIDIWGMPEIPEHE